MVSILERQLFCQPRTYHESIVLITFLDDEFAKVRPFSPNSFTRNMCQL